MIFFGMDILQRDETLHCTDGNIVYNVTIEFVNGQKAKLNADY